MLPCCFCSSAVTTEESRPPDRNIPTGTSETMRSRNASDHQRFELLGELIFVALQRILQRVEDAPVPADDRLAALFQFEPVAGLELEDMLDRCCAAR